MDWAGPCWVRTILPPPSRLSAGCWRSNPRRSSPRVPFTAGRWPGSSLASLARRLKISRPCWRPEPAAADKSDARYVLGLCQAGLKKWAEAAETFRTLLKDDPRYAAADKVLYELAWTLKSQDKEKEAVEVFAQLTRAHAQSPLAAEGQYHLGEFAYKANDFRTAAAAYHAAADKAGKSELGEKATHKLAWTYYRMDNVGMTP